MGMTDRIKVLVVDDSMFFRAAIVKGISEDPSIRVVGEASDPYEARDKILELAPNVITLDIQMPLMNGVEFLKFLMPQCPLPVVVVSSMKALAGECLKNGAVDFLAKPEDRSSEAFANFTSELIKKVKAASHMTNPLKKPEKPAVHHPAAGTHRFNGVIAIGASTGGTQATTKVLNALPDDMPGIVVVQHMPPAFTKMYADSLSKTCGMNVREAADGDQVIPGQVLIAPGDRQCEVIQRGTGYYVKCFHAAKVSGHCPSVDVLFSSLAKNVGKNSVGIIMTGMGADGARGLLEMRNKGAFTIGQDEKSCVVYGMPKEAFEMGAVVKQVSLDFIATTLISYVRDMRV